MHSQLPTTVKPRSNRRILVVSGIVGILAVVALLGGGAYYWLSAHKVTGLEGTWRDPNNNKHTYEFHRNGKVAAYFGGSPSWWNKIGWDATWRRDGQKITVRTDRNWDFVGELDGDVIRGKMLLKNQNGVVESETPVTWQRD
jgi:hypothetical protein